MNRSHIATSKFLSLILRHRPETIGVQLDEQGWLEIDVLIEAANRRGKRLSLELVHDVVANNDKRRFALSDDGLRIRANQGHSLSSVDLQLEPIEPPAELFHGTVSPFLESIRQQGLQKRSRQHVHLSADQETAARVGQRRGSPVILMVQAGLMHEQGHTFYQSANGVWLTDAVPPRFLVMPT